MLQDVPGIVDLDHVMLGSAGIGMESLGQFPVSSSDLSQTRSGTAGEAEDCQRPGVSHAGIIERGETATNPKHRANS